MNISKKAQKVFVGMSGGVDPSQIKNQFDGASSLNNFVL
jgi:hypothetical protein